MPPKLSSDHPEVPARVPRISDQLAALIRSSGQLPTDLARDAGVAPSVLTRFLRGERGLSSESIDRIADALGGLRLVRVRGRATPGRQPGRG
jgi:hypothetical protein